MVFTRARAAFQSCAMVLTRARAALAATFAQQNGFQVNSEGLTGDEVAAQRRVIKSGGRMSNDKKRYSKERAALDRLYGSLPESAKDIIRSSGPSEAQQASRWDQKSHQGAGFAKPTRTQRRLQADAAKEHARARREHKLKYRATEAIKAKYIPLGTTRSRDVVDRATAQVENFSNHANETALLPITNQASPNSMISMDDLIARLQRIGVRVVSLPYEQGPPGSNVVGRQDSNQLWLDASQKCRVPMPTIVDAPRHAVVIPSAPRAMQNNLKPPSAPRAMRDQFMLPSAPGSLQQNNLMPPPAPGFLEQNNLMLPSTPGPLQNKLAPTGLDILESIVGRRFSDLKTLLKATPGNKESDRKYTMRLALVGDRALGLVLTQKYYRLGPEWDNGDIARMWQPTATNRNLTEVGTRLGLHRFAWKQEGKSVADTVEAIIGAAYLEGGIGAAAEVMANLGLH